ncbi:MAG: NAD(P)-dependent oxidoreductase [Candidatus Omnitrophota bacterium]|nr:NAD(P)-dependent oxidoreductase [Candidatus Omnitrophota bacterium]MDZ4241387.1 NAD(P)-dependent oxidoreductase [Candidatus Omnitrophota bacterium]
MANPKILITGVCGFAGRALSAELARNGYTVHGLDSASPGVQLPEGCSSFHRVDISRAFPQEGYFDFVFHLAAYNVTHVGDRSPEKYREVNVLGTEHVLSGVSSSHFVLLSTVKVYRNEGKPLAEDSPLEPQGEYEKSKLAAENLCRATLANGNLCVLRCVNIMGPGQAVKAVVPVLFDRAARGEPLEIFAPKESFLQFLSIRDLVSCCLEIVRKEGISGTFNAASPGRIRLDELAFAIRDICGSSSEVRFTGPQAEPFSEVLCENLGRALGWSPRMTIHEMLEDYYRACYPDGHPPKP